MDIKIYVSPNCTWSKKTTEWLQKNKFSFQELDVMESDKYRDELLEKSNQMSTPVVDVNGQIVIGFNESQLMQAVGKVK